MGGNGLDMIVISREALRYRGHSQIPACTFMHKTVCVCICRTDVIIYECGPIIWKRSFFPLFTGFLFKKHSKLKVNSFLLRDLSTFPAVPQWCLKIHKKETFPAFRILEPNNFNSSDFCVRAVCLHAGCSCAYNACKPLSPTQSAPLSISDNKSLWFLRQTNKECIQTTV